MATRYFGTEDAVRSWAEENPEKSKKYRSIRLGAHGYYASVVEPGMPWEELHPTAGWRDMKTLEPEDPHGDESTDVGGWEDH